MEEAFEGIYTKEFTMFYKDTLEWYFTIEEAENVTETVRQFYTFQGPLSQHGVTRYDLINQMIQADESGEEANVSGIGCKVCRNAVPGGRNFQIELNRSET